jgi:hypothetical protein
MDKKDQPGPKEADAGIAVIAQVLKAAEPRPSRSDPVGAKNQYAVRFADHMATQIAADLFERLEDITATTKRTVASGPRQKATRHQLQYTAARFGLGYLAQIGTPS